MRHSVVSLCVFFLFLACSAAPEQTVTSPSPELDPARWAIAIHGGAGTIRRDAPPERLQAYREAIRGALEAGSAMLRDGDSALDVCEAVVRTLEDNALFNAGRGAVFNAEGKHELDASIMDGATLAAGAVASVRTVRHPITLARRVMTDTEHVLLAGRGAEAFADVAGVERVDNDWFDTERRRRSLERMLERERKEQHGRLDSVEARDPRWEYGTVGCVVCDQQGRLAAATSTGGRTGKRWGRVGDTPLLGAGNYADGIAAVSCTGKGEEFIRHAIARSVSARMEFGGQTLGEACDGLVHDVLEPADGGLVAVDREGNISMPYNSAGMYRGAASSSGRLEVRIFEDS